MACKAPCGVKIALLLGIVGFLLAACKVGIQTPGITQLPPSPTLLPFTPTPQPPTPTPIPLAALVNGEAITLAEFEAELARFRAAPGIAGTEMAQGGEQRVLEDLIAQVLLAQAALEAGFTLEEPALQGRIDALSAQLGGSQAINDWISAHGYHEVDFRMALRRAIAAAWMRDKIVSAVPQTAEQIHARQILLYNSDAAEEVLAQIRAGTDFATLAVKYDPVAGGDLGWFPRGTLTYAALEDASFALTENQVSDIVQTPLGYHVIQVIERDPQRSLDPSARLALQAKALQDWLEERRRESRIEIFLS
jgi:parvulin-like peptidyl-prolyl isomerase